MRMHDVLLILFKVANILAVVLLVCSYVLNIIARARKSVMVTANISFPVFSEQHSMIKHSFWCGTVFVLLNWLLCSSKVLVVSGKTTNVLSEGLLTFAIIWAIMIFAGIVAEIVMKCFKSNGSTTYSVAAGIKSSIWYSVLYFVLSFLIA